MKPQIRTYFAWAIWCVQKKPRKSGFLVEHADDGSLSKSPLTFRNKAEADAVAAREVHPNMTTRVVVVKIDMEWDGVTP